MSNASEHPIELYKRAAQFGNETGARAYEELAAKLEGAENARAEAFTREQIRSAQQLQQQRLILEFLGAALRHVH